MRTLQIANVAYNPNLTSPAGFLLIAGPCVIESLDMCLRIGESIALSARKLGLPYVFKASFDKANRSSVNSPRGLGLDAGLKILDQVKSQLALPVTTDIHESHHAAPVAQVCDILQIPAFLCRQTDLLVAAAHTGKIVSIKKGQFLSPPEMSNAVEKVQASGNPHIMLIERGTFFGYNRLVNDFTGIPQMQALGITPANPHGTPVIMDATHSTQLPGGLGTSTAGQRQFVPLLAKAAVASGANGLFIEAHPTPEKSPSDAATIYPLDQLEKLLVQCLAIRAASLNS